MKIIHSADIQVKNREKNLLIPTRKTLKQIESIISTQKAEIYIMAGDLFEYPVPTDSERKLMYNHISRLLNIPTLKEIVIMAGNHDLLKDKKQNESTIGNNPINVFIDLLKNLDKTLSDKIIYINESKIYYSKVSNKFQYVGYSLEDNEDFIEQFFEDGKSFLSDKFNICLHHGMLKEYVDSAKLPIRKDVYSALDSIEMFPDNSLICAGDIHMNLTFVGQKGQVYKYPGSPLQHTHNEGTFLRISESNNLPDDFPDETFYNVNLQKLAEKKSLKCYEFQNDENIPLSLLSVDGSETIKTYDLPLEDTVHYYTIELDPKLPIEIIYGTISTKLINVLNYDCQCFLKIKSSNVFLKYEQKIYDSLTHCFKIHDEKSKFQITFEYDKLIQNALTVNNKVIQEILDEKSEELAIKSEINLEQEGSEEYEINILETSNIDDLILSDEQIAKLFNSVLDLSLKSVDDSDITNQELSSDIRSLFLNEIAKVGNTSSKRYNIQLDYVECNAFMALTNNRIQLDIPGKTRILGTNGIGKTTLYSMIRWVISGEVFADMSKSSSTKNNLIVFNKNDINQDIICGKLATYINNLPVLLTRTIERKWKNNTTDEQKSSLKWKSFVSTVDKKFTIDVIKPSRDGVDGTTQQLFGDVAENSIKIWFGDVLNNILFMNQVKLEKLLTTASDKLNEMVLDFVGITYLKKLEDNLDDVKNELMLSVTKPTKTREEIHILITDCEIFIDKQKSKIDSLNQDQIVLENEIKINERDKEKENEQLQNIGNIPQQIIDTNIDLTVLSEYLVKFEEKVKKIKIEFLEIKPELDSTSITSTEKQIEIDQKLIENSESRIKTAEENKKLYLESIETIAEEQTKEIDLLLKQNSEVLYSLQISLTTGFKQIQTYFDETLKKLEAKSDEKKKILSEYSFDLDTNKIQIEKNLKTIKSGFCSECGKAFSENSEAHKEKLLLENIELTTKNENNIIQIKSVSDLIIKIKNLTTQYTKYHISAIKQEMGILENDLVKKDLQPSIDYINNCQEEILEYKKKQEGLNLDKLNWKLCDKVKYDDFEVDGKIIYPILQSNIKSIKELNQDIEKDLNLKNEYNQNIRKFNKIINDFKTEYVEALEKYQKLYDKNVKDNNDIEKENEKVDIHNNSKLIKQSEYSKMLLVLNELEKEKLSKYNIVKEFYDERVRKSEEFKTSHKELLKFIHEEEAKLQQFENQSVTYTAQYANYLLYQKNNLIWKLYSKLIKNNFKEIIFEYYRNFLNTTLNVLLEDVPFKLFWNEDSDLYHVSYDKGIVTYQPVQQSSGMETTYLGLALMYTIHLLNVKNSISHIFIDEISGTLNSGNELSYKAQNYKELLVLVLNKFKDKSIFIIDHSIDNLYETVTYEVRPDLNGSKYFKLN